MTSADYWRKRFEILEAAQHKEAVMVLDDIRRQFNMAQKTIEDQIYSWYGRFANNNQIDLAEARRLLNGRELAEFRWDVNEYIKRGQAVALNPEYIRQLENASARFHVSRLEALKIQTQNTVERLYGNQSDAIDALMKKTYLEGYYRSAYEIQRGTGVGWDIAGLNENQIQKIVSKPWTVDKTTFSDRLWTQKDKLIYEVHTQLTQNMILGKAPDDAIKAIAAKFNTSKHNAGRLVMTESAYFTTIAEKDAYKELGVEKYEILGTLDNRTCEVCGALDGEKGPISQLTAGVTAPPFHVFCRCTTVPYFADDAGERLARSKDGETYFVDSKMTYEDWKKKFVDTEAGKGYNNNVNDRVAVDGIVKHIGIDDVQLALENKAIDPEVIEVITKCISKVEKSGEAYINEFTVVSLGKTEPRTVLFQIEPLLIGRQTGIRFIVNKDVLSGRTLLEINELIANTSVNIAQSLNEAVIHEIGHAKLIQGKSIKEIEIMYKELGSKGILGISEIALEDGAEAIAEIEILIKRGTTLSEEAERLYISYIGGLKL